MRCRQSIEMVDPIPVWTRKGMPATRGECPDCGGAVFRMGKSNAHHEEQRPKAVEVTGSSKRIMPKLERDTVYVMFAPEDEAIARQIADDLNKIGIAAWMHETEDDHVAWAGGVHPALKECKRMIYVLSAAALGKPDMEAGWQFFREHRKPVVIAQIADSAPPDAIRRSPRFDFTVEYKRAFREMVQVLQ